MGKNKNDGITNPNLSKRIIYSLFKLATSSVDLGSAATTGSNLCQALKPKESDIYRSTEPARNLYSTRRS